MNEATQMALPSEPLEILTAKDVARILKISLSMVYRLKAQGFLPATYKLFEGEKGFRWIKATVDQYLSRKMISRYEYESLQELQQSAKFVPVSFVTPRSVHEPRR